MPDDDGIGLALLFIGASMLVMALVVQRRALISQDASNAQWEQITQSVTAGRYFIIPKDADYTIDFGQDVSVALSGRPGRSGVAQTMVLHEVVAMTLMRSHQPKKPSNSVMQ